MHGTLIEVTLRDSGSLEGIATQSFNNDSVTDTKRNSFNGSVPPFEFYSPKKKEKVPPKFLLPNVHHYGSSEIYRSGDMIVVGEYCNEGIVVPRTFGIAFNQLYNCAPLISLIKGDEVYVSYLHTWAIPGNPEVVDKQVKHWMETILRFGEISETVFAPRKDSISGSDTRYQHAIDDITRRSQRTILLMRNLGELSGIVNGEGVYFNRCGYHLWGN
jgi:hypothetical protein